MQLKYLIIILFFLIPFSSSAQLLGASNSIGISSQPTHPEPEKEVVLKLDAYSLDTIGSEITWSINGVNSEESINSTEFVLETGKLGETLVVKANIVLRDGTIHEAIHTITPSRTNLTIEADTHTPYFYQGRSEPSIGSTIRAISVPETGSGANPAVYTYRWEVNGNVLFGGPVTGRNVVEFDVPFGNEVQIRLDVLSQATGNVVASTREYVPIVEPEINFYEQSLLIGGSHNAIGKTYNLLSDEVSIKAEPYFMSNVHLQDSPKLEWKLNGETISNPNVSPFLITLRNAGSGGSATISFSSRSTRTLSQYAKDSFEVSF